MNNSKNKETFLFISLSAGSLLYFILISIINLFRFNYRMNADIASDVILGELIWNSKQIIPDTWYGSTEARIISNSNMAALFFGLVHNMTLAMGLACCMMTLLIILSVIYFCHAADLKKSHAALMVFLCLILPCNLNILLRMRKKDFIEPLEWAWLTVCSYIISAQYFPSILSCCSFKLPPPI